MRFIICLFTFAVISLSAFSQGDSVQLKTTLKNAKTDDDRLEAYRAVFKYYQFAEPNTANYYLNEALVEFKSKKNQKCEAAVLVMQGFMHSSHGRLEVAKEKQLEALAIYAKLHNKKGMAAAHNGVGVALGKNGKYTEAARHFMEALKLYEELKDGDGIANAYLKLGVVQDESGNWDKALEFYNKALGYVLKNKVKNITTSDLYDNIGVVYGKKGDYPKALSYFEKSLEINNTSDRSGGRVYTLNNIGILYDKMNEDKKSLMYFDSALKIAKEWDMDEEYTRTMVSKASVVSKTNPAAAIVSLKEALGTVKEMGIKSLEADLYDNMVDVYQLLGNYKDALETHRLLKRLEDSMFNMEKVKEIANMEATYELQEAKERVVEAEERSDTNKKISNVIIGVAVALAVVLILVSLVYRRTMRLNAALAKNEAELRKTNEVKDRLFSIIGHDLRGPIGNVAVTLELLEDKDTSPEDRRYILTNLILHSKATMETLDKLLYWGQSQIKGIGMEQKAFTVGEPLQNNIELINAAAEQKLITIVNNIAADTGVYADPVHFDFIMRNLLSNAVKFTHNNGTITLSVDTKAKPGLVVFSVKDTGIGISNDKLKDIFKPFNNSTPGTNEEKGTSIGLMLCKEFVTENGGNIWVESEEGKGSTFYFSLKASA